MKRNKNTKKIIAKNFIIMLVVLLGIGVFSTSFLTLILGKVFTKSFNKSCKERIDHIDKQQILSASDEKLMNLPAELVAFDENGEIMQRKGATFLYDDEYYYEHQKIYVEEKSTSEKPHYIYEQKLYLDNEDLRAFKMSVKNNQPTYLIVNIWDFAQNKILRWYSMIAFISIAFIIFLVLLTFYLFIRSIYRPINRNFTIIEKNISKYPNKFCPIDESEIDLEEAKNIAKKYNMVVRSFEEEQDQKKKAVESGEMLISNLAHDLKSPITVLKGYTEVLMNEDLNDEETKKYLGYIYKGSNDLSILVTQLFDQIKYKNGQVNTKKENMDICILLRNCCANYYTVFTKMGFDFEVEIPENPVISYLDEVQIKRLFNNLLQNVIDHNEEPCKVRVTLEKVKNKVLIQFKNDGEDISQKNRENLFNAFYQSDTSRNNTNSGLGLFIAKQIVEQHEGSISVAKNKKFNVIFEVVLNCE